MNTSTAGNATVALMALELDRSCSREQIRPRVFISSILDKKIASISEIFRHLAMSLRGSLGIVRSPL